MLKGDMDEALPTGDAGEVADPRLPADLDHRRAFPTLFQDKSVSRGTVNIAALIALSSTPGK